MNQPTSHNNLLLLKRLHLGIRRAMDEALANHGLTGPQLEILRQLWEENGLEQRALAERLGITPATLTGIVDGLVERELLERRLSAEDARVKQLFLTCRGKALNSELAALFGSVQQRLCAGFSPSELLLLHDWLTRMAHNIGAPGGDCH